jgi:hypothetical protein
MEPTGFWQGFRNSLLIAVLAALPLLGQSGNGVVQGSVLDATKAGVPGAKATLRNTPTGVSRNTEANEVGVYHFGAVPPGPYTLTVEASGFKRWSGTLTVEVGQTVTINPAMEVGSVEATVEVTGAAPVIATEGMQVSDIKDALRIQQLPLNGRFVTNLFDLTPGVEGGANPRVNGLKVGSVEMLLDGVSLTDRYGGGISRVQPGLDTIQEYRIETAGSGAQYSRPATISLVTKSGTNEIHGSAFWTHRNNFGGLRARQRQDFSDPPQYIRNEFGASAGGPIIRNKTFWFFAYEGQTEREARFARASMPTDAIWNGDFSAARTINDEKITIYNPLSTAANGTRMPFPNNQIPSNMIVPFAQTMRTVSADPAGPNAGFDPWLGSNFEAYYGVKRDIDTYTAKIDHVFSEKDNISGRVTRSIRPYKLFGGQYGFPPPGATDAGGTGRQDSTTNTAFARWNHVFSPTFLNEFQASGYRSWHSQGTLADDTDWGNKLGFPNPFGATGWPTICGASPFFYSGCWDADNRGNFGLSNFTIEDNVTWIKGKHTVKFGFKGRQEYNNTGWWQQAQGSHTFGSQWTQQYDPASDQAVSFTGNGFASVLMGLPTYLSVQYNRGYYYFRQKEFGPYIQDTWRVTPRLTLDVGLRWDKWTVYKEKFDRLVNLDLEKGLAEPNSFEVITPGNTRMEDLPGIPPSLLTSWAARGLSWKTAREAGFPDGLLPADNNNFAPRIGVAFRVTDKWVMRSGYGVYYWTMPLSQILDSQRTNPPLNLRYQNNLSDQNGLTPNYALKNRPDATDYIGAARIDTEGIVPISINAQAGMAFDVNSWSENKAQEWTFTLERELMRETALRLSYIGNHGSDLEQRWRWDEPESEWNYQARTGLARPSRVDLRRINPNWTSGCCNAPILHNGYSNAHSVQAEVERRYSSGLAFQTFYVWSHAMTTNDAGGFTFGSSSFNSTGGGTIFAVPENWQILGSPKLTEDQRLRLGYYNSANIPSHRVRWNGIYDLPFGKGKKFGGNTSGVLNHLIGGWQISFIGDWRSGSWSSVSSGLYLFGDPTLDADERLELTFSGRSQRLWFRGDFNPLLASNVDQTRLQQLVPADRSQRVLKPVGDRFDNQIPQVLADGTVRLTPINGDNVNWNARNFFRGPGAWNQDISLFKNIYVTERVRTRVTADFFNALNHPVDGGPSGSTGLQDLSTQSNAPRIIQLSLRVEW